MKYAGTLRKLKAAQKRIGSERDKLRDLLDEIEEQHKDTEEACENLEQAIEALSRLT